ncbi:phosphotransferase [Glycomyces dulcitolivorans]|uniref:phosphotransferase n=1 Tax=Glycomyces dulcitolivorans TaxID=2200759 RepID=UPI000DD35D63|nr:phosphotransferase [Glycomyces dulcitolivorans]
MSTFKKRYRSPEECAAASRHYRWLAQHLPIVRRPRLVSADKTTLVFEHVNGRKVLPSDLATVAEHLGHVHGIANAGPLAHLDLTAGSAGPADAIFTRAYFPSRAETLLRRYRDGHIASRESLRRLSLILERTAQLPAAIYKDANCRNFIVTTEDTPFTIDFDDLDPAPMGYDLAKLAVSLQMTYGALPASALTAALDRYNQASATHTRAAPISAEQFTDLLTLQAVLTAPYLGKHHYTHPIDTITTVLEPR